MKWKKRLSIFLAAIIALTPMQEVFAEAFAQMEQQAFAAAESITPGSPGEPGVTPNHPDATSKAAVADLKLVYQESDDVITLTYQMNSECEYVRIYVDGKEEEKEYTGTTYDYRNVRDGRTYEFRIVPYDKKGAPGTEARISCEVPYKKAVVEDVDAEYNLEKQVLIVDWEGDAIDYADVYQDNVLIAEKVKESRLILEIKLEPESKHTYKIVPYNRIDEIGLEKSYLLEVDDYVARIERLQIDYMEDAKQIRMNWDDAYTEYVSIYLNDEELATKYTKKDFVINCELQPGAKYLVNIVPYNYRDKEGEEEEEDVSVGYFDIPDEFSASLVNVPIKDAKGNLTGFSRPSVQLSWEAQKRAIYEIYRADEKDKKSEYKWIATIKSELEGKYVYTDEKAGFGNYYYKIRRRIAEDTYIDQELYTALSDAENVNVYVPRPEVKAFLNKDGKIALSMSSKREFVSGYDIYRKTGKGSYKHLTTVTGDEYVDTTVEPGEKYSYKVKAYYYDVSSKKKISGKNSNAATVKTAVSSILAEAQAISADTVKVTWTPAANAKEYEIYYKTGTQGDSYALWKTTDQLTFCRKVGKSGRHYFMIKACCTIGGKDYFSSAEVSVKMGFCAPEGLKIEKTTYKRNKATKAINQKSVISWNQVYGAKGYYVEAYDEASKQYRRVAKIKNSRKTSYTVTTLLSANAKPLKYRVSAYLGKKIKKGKTIDIVPALGMVKNVKAVQSGTKVKISWKKVTGAERYQVYRSNGRTMLLVGETSGSSILDQGLSVGIPYKYYVQALNQTQKITGEKSLPVDFMTKRNAITGFKAVNTSLGSVHLSWNPDKEATGYRIYFKKSKDGKYQKLADVDAKTKLYVHKNLASGTNCYYKITAVLTNCGGIAVESDGDLAEVKVSK